MKANIRILVAIAMIASAACSKKENEMVPAPVPPGNTDNYSSMADFYIKNGVQSQFFTIDVATGGSFTTPKGTVVTIPAHAFITQSGAEVTGNVQVEFKDIYKKSDMLLSDKGTAATAIPLVSGGEFFIKVKSGAQQVVVAPGQNLMVALPTTNPDTAMAAFVGVIDTIVTGTTNNAITWIPDTSINMLYTNTQYIWNSSWQGWGNSDNCFTFQGLPQTKLTCHPTDDPDAYQTDVFMIFKNINTCIHVYHEWNGGQLSDNFAYNYSPIGFECTLVAVGVKEGKLYSSFTPVTLSSNQTVNFTMMLTSTEAFKAGIDALN